MANHMYLESIARDACLTLPQMIEVFNRMVEKGYYVYSGHGSTYYPGPKYRHPGWSPECGS